MFRRKRNARPLTEAQRAREDAVQHLAHAESRGSEIRRLSRSLREIREQNHFVAQIERLMHGRTS